MIGSRHPGLWLLAALLIGALPGCGGEPASCEICGRNECTNMTLVLTRADGSRQQTCCARCGARLIARGASPPTSITVRDFDTARPVDVEQAVFVEGSDVHPCRGVIDNPPRDERGCCLKAVYDRCEPSVVAFATAEAARRFIEQHGGRPTSWIALTEAVAGS